jgi:arabinan endo-1,5-alpha-L-arabinosidase
MKIAWSVLLFLSFSFHVFGQADVQNISVHDPVMAKQGDTYYLFSTGKGIAMWSSTDLKNWKSEKPIFF